MSWANERVFTAVQALPDEALTSYLVNPDFDAARILQHIVEGAEWFAYCLCQNPWRPRIRPKTMADVVVLANELRELETIILREGALQDERLSFDDEDGVRNVWRSTIISQTIHHATEHRAQLIDALELRGHKPINLDDLDLWAFEEFEETR
jgi:uncharacterized damage-inducible protein DinB